MYSITTQTTIQRKKSLSDTGVDSGAQTKRQNLSRPHSDRLCALLSRSDSDMALSSIGERKAVSVSTFRSHWKREFASDYDGVALELKNRKAYKDDYWKIKCPVIWWDGLFKSYVKIFVFGSGIWFFCILADICVLKYIEHKNVLK
jgi:hypothetical protein